MKESVELEIQEKLEALENRVQLLEIIVKKGTTAQSEILLEKKVKVIQINEKLPPNRYDNKGKLIGKKHVCRGPFFCMTPQEQRIFESKNPDMQTESFNIEFAQDVAERLLNKPENKKEFERVAS